MLDFPNKIKIVIISGLAFISACQNETSEDHYIEDQNRVENKVDGHSLKDRTDAENKENEIVRLDSASIQSLPFGLVDIQLINPEIQVDLKYATMDNFMKIRLYDTLQKAYLQKEVAIRLGKCQEYLHSLNPDLFLMVYDAVRPISVQQKMWDALDSIPVDQRVKFVSNPANGSIHNYGAAVDLTICTKNGMPLDMGAGYDDIRLIAYPSKESYYLKTGELTEAQIANRVLLRKVMSSQNFKNIKTEWWHFNAFPRNVAKSKFKALR